MCAKTFLSKRRNIFIPSSFLLRLCNFDRRVRPRWFLCCCFHDIVFLLRILFGLSVQLRDHIYKDPSPTYQTPPEISLPLILLLVENRCFSLCRKKPSLRKEIHLRPRKTYEERSIRRHLIKVAPCYKESLAPCSLSSSMQ